MYQGMWVKCLKKGSHPSQVTPTFTFPERNKRKGAPRDRKIIVSLQKPRNGKELSQKQMFKLAKVKSVELDDYVRFLL